MVTVLIIIYIYIYNSAQLWVWSLQCNSRPAASLSISEVLTDTHEKVKIKGHTIRSYAAREIKFFFCWVGYTYAQRYESYRYHSRWRASKTFLSSALL